LHHVREADHNHHMTTPSVPKIGIIGDFMASNPTHAGTNAALEYTGDCSFEWLPTDTAHDYGKFDGLICSPGSPYRNEQGALDGVEYARKNGIPLLGTCGGFQHLVLEFARNVASVKEAAHQENDPSASVLFLTRLACSVAGKNMNVTIARDTLAHRCYSSDTAEESYYCNFGLNPEHRSTLVTAGLTVSGWDETNEVRIVELAGHPFFVGTLFVPQMRSTPERAHPLITGFLNAAALRSKHGN
jgi:CTP synthase (UTP-ammonia lyase)